jgi:ComF family protein
MFNKEIKSIKDVLFPVFCVSCGQEGEWWCEACLRKNKFSPVCRCPGCGKKNDGELCLGCRGFFNLDGAAAFIEYSEKSPAGRLLREFKYHYASDIKSVWEKIILSAGMPLGDFLFAGEAGEDSWHVAPVPLHSRRERERGYNQARIIAEIILIYLRNKYSGRHFILDDNSLSRVRPTAQQAKLSKEERVKNIAGAFAPGKAVPENVILVDDVYTSGATLEECARALKSAGAKKVFAITLAQTVWK